MARGPVGGVPFVLRPLVQPEGPRLSPGATTVALSRRRLYLTLLVGWVFLTFALTSIPHPNIHFSFRFADKAYHFWFYGVMGFLCALWRRESGVPPKRAIFEGLLFTMVAGAFDEVHQHWIPGRSMELLDWMADAMGGGIGACLSVFLPHLFPFLITE